MIPATSLAALQLLREIGAPPRLRRHAELVGEAADALLLGFRRLGIPLNGDYVRVGAALHDAGKTLYPHELDVSGNSHEAAGEQLLLAHGATPEIARVCRSHAAWRDVAETLEELVIALADKLWKGARVSELEEAIVDRAAATIGADRWHLFTVLDTLFEEIAAGADERLARS